ncbi:MAG: hypothetical protein J1E31_06060 [Helicobacter sp.]|nr:hypothetical protein [Helicobacter sp.]
MIINQNLNGLGSVINEANKLLGDTKTSSSNQISQSSSIKQISENKQEEESLTGERNTYGMISLELMNDEQYRAFQRVTAGMSVSEKIEVAQTLTRAGNLSASVEKVVEREKQLGEEQKQEVGFLGISSKGWEEVSEEFQDNLNHLNGLYTKNYRKSISANYNDILKRNQEAKTQRILREFSHAIFAGNLKIDMMS